MDTSVQTTISTCQLCQTNDKTAKTHVTPLQPISLPEGPWQKCGIDIVGLFETTPADCRYVITLVNYYSKWPEAVFTSNVTTQTIIKFLTDLFRRHGNCYEIVNDNGAQFTSKEWTSFLHDRDIKHSNVSMYYPRANGVVERWTRVLKDCLQMANRVPPSLTMRAY